MGKIIQTDPKYWLAKKAQRKTGFPLATIAFYGPNDQSASKIVVGIFVREGQKEPMMKKWFSSEGDIRINTGILLQIVEFLQENHAERVSMADRIIGCPHEEGIDYQSGEPCPECRFWANRDRFTGELV